MKIRKAIFTYWNPLHDGTGFLSIEDFLYTFSLSVNVAKNHFEEIELYTDNYGKELIEKLNLPLTINTKLEYLNDIRLEHVYWGYAKLVAYADCNEPFIHIDNDVLLWNGIPSKFDDMDFVFQSIETFNTNIRYKPLLDLYNLFKIKPITVNPNQTYAYNCGIMVCRDLSIVKELRKLATLYLSKENYWVLQEEKDYHNFFFEQYILTYLIDKKGSSVGLLFDNPDVSKCDFSGDYKYTHLWGNSKESSEIIERVKQRLLKDYPDYYYKLN